MRAAPAVSVPIGVSARWQAVQSLLWVLAAVVCCAWWLARSGQQTAWALAAALPVAGLAWHRLRTPAATLAWDGESWLLDGVPVRVTVALDLDPWLLLRLQTDTGDGWLPATAQQAGGHWHALRAALYSRAPEAPLAAASPAPPQGASAPD